LPSSSKHKLVAAILEIEERDHKFCIGETDIAKLAERAWSEHIRYSCHRVGRA